MTDHENHDKLISGYDQMLKRVRDWIQNVEDKTVPAIEKAIDDAREKAMELGELSREEADQVSRYVQRDLLHLGEHIKEEDQDLKTWFHIDMELIEDELADIFSSVADPTTVELLRLREIASLSDYWKTGEITGPGVLQCTECDELLHFHKISHIPPCPKCRGILFKRVSGANQD
jgi:hypothetical protein